MRVQKANTKKSTAPTTKVKNQNAGKSIAVRGKTPTKKAEQTDKVREGKESRQDESQLSAEAKNEKGVDGESERVNQLTSMLEQVLKENEELKNEQKPEEAKPEAHAAEAPAEAAPAEAPKSEPGKLDLELQGMASQILGANLKGQDSSQAQQQLQVKFQEVGAEKSTKISPQTKGLVQIALGGQNPMFGQMMAARNGLLGLGGMSNGNVGGYLNTRPNFGGSNFPGTF